MYGPSFGAPGGECAPCPPGGFASDALQETFCRRSPWSMAAYQSILEPACRLRSLVRTPCNAQRLWLNSRAAGAAAVLMAARKSEGLSIPQIRSLLSTTTSLVRSTQEKKSGYSTVALQGSGTLSPPRGGGVTDGQRVQA